MWRPLVDVRDCADAMIAAIEAPAEQVRGEIFNVLHSNYQIRELAMLVAGSVQLLGRVGHAQGGARPAAHPRLRVLERQAVEPLGFQPSRSVVEAVDGILASIDVEDKTMLTDPRFYNIRWLELLSEVTPQLDHFRGGSVRQRVSSPAAEASSPPTSRRCCGQRGGPRAAPRRARHHRRRRGRRASSPRSDPTSSSTARRSTTSTSASARRTRRSR